MYFRLEGHMISVMVTHSVTITKRIPRQYRNAYVWLCSPLPNFMGTEIEISRSFSCAMSWYSFLAFYKWLWAEEVAQEISGLLHKHEDQSSQSQCSQSLCSQSQCSQSQCSQSLCSQSLCSQSLCSQSHAHSPRTHNICAHNPFAHNPFAHNTALTYKPCRQT